MEANNVYFQYLMRNDRPEEEVQEAIKGLKFVKESVGYGYQGNLIAYKGRYGKGYKVCSNPFYGKDHKVYHKVKYFVEVADSGQVEKP